MTDTTTIAAAGSQAEAGDAGPLGQGQRMQQRLQWEKALYSARETMPRDARADAQSAPTAADEIARGADSPPDPAQEKVHAPPDAAAPAESHGRTPVITQAVIVRPAAAVSTALPQAAAARAAATPEALARHGVERTAPASRPPVATSPGSAPEAQAVHLHETEGRVRMSLRDARLSPKTAGGLVSRLRAIFGRIGLALEALTLNGRPLIDDSRPPVSAPQKQPDDRLDRIF